VSTPTWEARGRLPFPEHVPFSHAGLLVVRPGRSPYPITGGPLQIVSIAAALGTASVGGPVVLDVNINGVSIYADPADRPRFEVGETLAVVGDHTATTVTDGDVLTIDVDEVGPSVPGADLVVNVRLQQT
jgi:hypothetical protein